MAGRELGTGMTGEFQPVNQWVGSSQAKRGGWLLVVNPIVRKFLRSTPRSRRTAGSVCALALRALVSRSGGRGALFPSRIAVKNLAFRANEFLCSLSAFIAVWFDIED